jgi:hypothetical protein
MKDQAEIKRTTVIKKIFTLKLENEQKKSHMEANCMMLAASQSGVNHGAVIRKY